MFLCTLCHVIRKYFKYRAKIAILIYKIYNYTTPSCFEHLIQMKESTYEVRVSIQHFETYLYHTEDKFSFYLFADDTKSIILIKILNRWNSV